MRSGAMSLILNETVPKKLINEFGFKERRTSYAPKQSNSNSLR